jgi:hypothetical protein
LALVATAASMQQQQKKKTAKGEGYTIRLSGGKKVLKTALLEEQVATVQKAYKWVLQVLIAR